MSEKEVLDVESFDVERSNEPKLLERTYESEIVESDGRTLIARIVPYNVEAIVADAPAFRPYREMFMPNAFERQVRAPGRGPRVWLNFEHEQGLRGIVGHGAQLDDQSDALYGHFRVMANADGDKALQLVEEKLLTGLSIEFGAIRSQRIDGVVRRVRAHLDKVSLCRFPAYESAQVLAVRETTIAPDDDDEPDDPDDDEQTQQGRAESAPTATPVLTEAIAYPADLEARLRALSVAPLERLKITTSSWDGSASRFSDEQYERAALIVRGGSDPIRERCSLLVFEPDGTLNVHALTIAATKLATIPNVTRAQRSEAARKLVRYWRAAGLDHPPANLLALGRGS